MFRTARGFLLSAPPAFLIALAAFLISHPKAAEAFAPYPFLSEAVHLAFPKSPVPRFTMMATLSFLVPYLVTGILLMLADLGASAAARLWSGKARPRPAVFLESRLAYVTALVGVSAAAGVSLHKVAHGGELPGGVNVSPILVAAVPFLAVLVALVVAGLVALPRGLHNLLNGPSGAPDHA